MEKDNFGAIFLLEPAATVYVYVNVFRSSKRVEQLALTKFLKGAKRGEKSGTTRKANHQDPFRLFPASAHTGM